MELTKEELDRIWDEWEAAVNADSGEAIDSGDDYYWRGASSFKKFIVRQIESASWAATRAKAIKP